MRTIKNILLTLLALVIVVGGTYAAIQWDAIVGKWQTEANREVFKQILNVGRRVYGFGTLEVCNGNRTRISLCNFQSELSRDVSVLFIGYGYGILAASRY